MAVSGFQGALQQLTDSLGRLPGIGARSAERLAHHLLRCPLDEALALAEAIQDARSGIKHCEACFHLTEADHALCAVCRDPRRDQTIICVVEQSRDLAALERAGAYQGVYHVLLGRLAPLQGIGPEHLTLDALEARVRSGSVREVVLATNPNLEGDGTALLVARRLEAAGVPLTRLARGLPSGGALEYANKDMISDALRGRQRVD